MQLNDGLIASLLLPAEPMVWGFVGFLGVHLGKMGDLGQMVCPTDGYGADITVVKPAIGVTVIVATVGDRPYRPYQPYQNRIDRRDKACLVSTTIVRSNRPFHPSVPPIRTDRPYNPTRTAWVQRLQFPSIYCVVANVFWHAFCT